MMIVFNRGLPKNGQENVQKRESSLQDTFALGVDENEPRINLQKF